MAQKGLDIDALQAGEYTGNQGPFGTNLVLGSTLSSITDQKQKAELEAQIAALEKTVKLLSGNNAAIDGTESYLDNLSWRRKFPVCEFGNFESTVRTL